MGFGFMAHGWAKWSRGPANFAKLLHQVGVPHPMLAAWSVTMLELFGGLALFVGAFVALVSIPLILSMIGAMLTVQLRYGFSSINTIGLTPDGPVFGPPGSVARAAPWQVGRPRVSYPACRPSIWVPSITPLLASTSSSSSA
jgi:putative oxidoreductase